MTAPSPAGTRRPAPAPVALRRLRGDAGVGSLEYIGMVTVLAVVVAAFAVVPASFPFRTAVAQALCSMFQGDCSAVVPPPPPQCEVSAAGREIGASVTAFSIKVGRKDSYEIVQFGDGKARVTTGDVLELGASASVGGGSSLSIGDDGAIGGGAKGSASVTASGGVKLLYDFEDGDEAADWVEDNRNIFAQSLNFAGGPLADGGEQLWNHLDDDRPDPSAIAFQVGAALRLGGEAGIGGTANVSGSGSASVTGVMQLNRDGTSSFTTTAASSAQGELLLAMASGELAGNASAGYSVTFDASGRPTSLKLSTVTGYRSAIGMNTLGLETGGRTITDVGWDFDIGEWGGETRTTTTLDLTDPANRAAFDEVFLLAGPVAAMDPRATFDGSVDALADRVAASGVAVTAAYAVDTSEVGFDVDAGAGVKFGLELGSDSFERRLLDAHVRDGASGAGWQPLSTC
ncbi:hypothetical protein [Aquipuribacter hungaricus]|uniref:Uncharacterized protein n=1 Tax=Aquipuribacter hungaricus TaxID=545624 RepID=A0ABV7WMF7_9MICO